MVGNGAPDSPREPLTPVLQSLGILAQVESEAERHAASSRTGREVERDIQTLEAYAESVIGQLPCTPFDPQGSAADAVRQHEYERDLDQRDIEQAAVDEADLHVRTRKLEAAQRNRGLKAPAVPLKDYLLFTCALAVSFGPTLKDELFVGIQDQVLGWVLALAAGGLVAATIVWPILTPQSNSRGGMRWLGLMAAIGFGVANLILRESAATTQQDHLLAFGLTAWEVAAVVFLEWVAAPYREKYEAWIAQEEALAMMAALRRAADDQLEGSQTRLSSRQRRIAAFLEYLDARAVLHERRADVVAAAKLAARQAYRARVNVNFGKLIGSEWREA
jgi:hypothetical protein